MPLRAHAASGFELPLPEGGRGENQALAWRRYDLSEEGNSVHEGLVEPRRQSWSEDASTGIETMIMSAPSPSSNALAAHAVPQRLGCARPSAQQPPAKRRHRLRAPGLRDRDLQGKPLLPSKPERALLESLRLGPLVSSHDSEPLMIDGEDEPRGVRFDDAVRSTEYLRDERLRGLRVVPEHNIGVRPDIHGTVWGRFDAGEGRRAVAEPVSRRRRRQPPGCQSMPFEDRAQSLCQSMPFEDRAQSLMVRTQDRVEHAHRTGCRCAMPAALEKGRNCGLTL